MANSNSSKIMHNANIRGKYIVVGLGKSGISASKFLLKKRKSVFVYDDNQEVLNKTIDSNPDFLGAEKLDLNNVAILENDIVVLTPGIDKDDLSHPIIKLANQSKTEVISMLDLYKYYNPEAFLLGITGTSGKTTITTLVYNIMKHLDFDVSYGGNIGIPFFDITPSNARYRILELSSYELSNSKSPYVNVALISNIYPCSHITRHKTFEKYLESKISLLLPSTQLVLSLDDPMTQSHVIPAITSKLGESYVEKNISFFSSKKRAENCISVIEGELYKGFLSLGKIEISNNKIANIDSNIAAAVAIIFTRRHVNANSVNLALRDFVGIEHRYEFVQSIEGIDVINDSKSTNFLSLESALLSSKKNIFLIIGGKDDGQSNESIITRLTNLLSNYKNVIKVFAIGEVTESLKGVRKIGRIPLSLSKKIEIAFDRALQSAIKHSDGGGVDCAVVFSPGFQSFDQFENFEHRGQVFKSIVKSTSSTLVEKNLQEINDHSANTKGKKSEKI